MRFPPSGLWLEVYPELAEGRGRAWLLTRHLSCRHKKRARRQMPRAPWTFSL